MGVVLGRGWVNGDHVNWGVLLGKYITQRLLMGNKNILVKNNQ